MAVLEHSHDHFGSVSLRGTEGKVDSAFEVYVETAIA